MKVLLIICMLAGIVSFANGCNPGNLKSYHYLVHLLEYKFFIMQKYICVSIQVVCKWRNWSRWTPCVGAMIEGCTTGRKTRVRTVEWNRCNRRPRGSQIETEWCNTDCQCMNDLLDGIFPFVLETVQLIVDTNCDNDRK